MRYLFSGLLPVLLLLYQLPLSSQNQAAKWYFGNEAGLDFMSNPPAIVQGSMNAPGGSASVSDAAGNLLFYTNGMTIWNQNHQVMATGLFGNLSGSQNCIIVKQPGNSNIYYVFTLELNSGLYYTTVDMSLSAGLGLVTSQNNLVMAAINFGGNLQYIDRISATKHCNGTDIWVIAKDCLWTNFANGPGNAESFYSYLITSAGVNTIPVVSPSTIWTSYVGYAEGTMKVSPKGTKIALASMLYNYNYLNSGCLFEIWDFNPATGAISNSLGLGANNWINNNWTWGYGCEFSPDGTKFYGSVPYGNNANVNNFGSVIQWDLCAGSPTAIAASEFTVATNFSNLLNLTNKPFSMQLAPNGKIYVARYNLTALDVINNPNALGSACAYSLQAQSLGTRTCQTGLPNFMTAYLSPPPPPFTYTVNNNTSCFTASFTAPNNPTFACAAMGYSVNGIIWNFGDPASGAANTSTLNSPAHAYPTPGTYTTTLTFLNACGQVTMAQAVVVNGASLTINTSSITCANLGSATVSAQGGIGPFSFTWTPTAQTSSVATGLIPGSYTIQVLDNGGNCAYSSSVTFAPLVPLTGVVDNAPSVPCNGVGTGTANIFLAGGSGGYTYTWTNAPTALNTASVSTLVGGVHTITVMDALTSCSVMQTFFINQPPALGLFVGSNSPTVCAGNTVTLTALSSGGTPGASPPYTYSWTAGPTTVSRTATQASPGNYTYWVTSWDGNNCPISNSISIGFIVNPTITVANTSICPLQTGTLTANGAASYTWLPSGATGSVFTDNPLTTTVYTLTGSALGCTATPKTASIVLKPIPSPTITSNSPVCNGQALTMSSNNGAAYQWNGPLGFNSFVQSPTINLATPARSGVYSFTLTGLNSCTASITTTLTVHPTPTISISASTVCVTQPLNLFASSFAGALFNWTGPASFTSSAQNPTRPAAAANMTGVYNLTVTSVQGCTNTAQTSASVVAMPVPLIVVNTPSLCLGSALSFTGSGGALYNWSGPNAFVSAIANPGITNIQLPANGIYTLLVTTGPCTITTTQSITVFPLPQPTAGSVPVCDTKDLHLTASGGVGYFWTGPYTYTSAAQNPTLAAASPSNSGFYTVLVTDVNGCQASTTTQALVMVNPDVRATSTAVCYGYPAVMTASGAVSYVWTNANGYLSYQQNAPVASATNTQALQFLVMGTAANSCTSIATAVLNTIPLPTPTASMTAKACLNSLIALGATGGDHYEWQGPYNYYSLQQNPSFVASNLAFTGIYTLTAFSNVGCLARTTTSLQLDPAPEGDLINSAGNACVPFCSEFSLRPRNAVPVSAMVWNVNGQIITQPTFTYCVVNAGDYVVSGSFTNALGCVNTTSFTISGYTLPKANFEFYPEFPVENFDQVKFTSTSSGASLLSYNWYIKDHYGPKISGQTTSYLFDREGIYPVALVVSNGWGCLDTIVKTIQVEADFNIYVPNGFTPNADELNDSFFAKGTGVAKFTLTVYDRWGEKLFETTDFSKGWDGTFKGQECKSDVYVWKLSATDVKGRNKQLNGFVTLYR